MQSHLSSLDRIKTSMSGCTLSVVVRRRDTYDIWWCGDSHVRVFDTSGGTMFETPSCNFEELSRVAKDEFSGDMWAAKKAYGVVRMMKDPRMEVVEGAPNFVVKPNLNSGYFTFVDYNTFNILDSLGHGGNTRGRILNHSVPVVPGQVVVVATDGIWDVFHSAEQCILDKSVRAGELVVEAIRRWNSVEWKIKGYESRQRFPPGSQDDIAIAKFCEPEDPDLKKKK